MDPKEPQSLRPFIPAEWRDGLLADLTGPELALCIAYWSYAGSDDVASPSLEALSETTGYRTVALTKARQRLIAKGLLIPVKHDRKGGQFGCKAFRVWWPNSPRPSAVTTSTVGGGNSNRGTVNGETISGETISGGTVRGGTADGEPYHGVPELIPDVPVVATSNGFKIPAGCRFTDELSPASKDLLEFVGFTCDRRFLSRGFMTIVEKYAKRRPWPRPGMLASKLITRCLHWQSKLRKAGENQLLYAFPPGLQKHRDRLRVAERTAGRQERAAAA